MTLIVSPSMAITVTENRIDSGIDMMMMMVERQLPRNSRIITPTSPAARTASRNTPTIAPFHEHGLVTHGVQSEAGRQALLNPGATGP